MQIFILAQKNWLFTIWRSLFGFIDFIVYSIISILFKTVFQLANFELAGFYEPIQQRVYVILGIFMLFKVTVSLLTYLVDPDKISDKEQGAGKVVTRIMTVLVMLIMLPNFFALMTEFQNKLLPVVPKIIIGTAFASNDNGSEAEKAGKNMARSLIDGFAPVSDECKQNEGLSIEGLITHINDTCDGSQTYIYEYRPLVSSIVGILMCYVLISLCISVAIRAFKLIILRMMAPIPIISYIDPKSSKDGMFATWTKTFISTWAELFVHIGLIYFIVYIIDFLLTGNAWKGFFSSSGTNDPFEGILLLSFILIGLLFFARQAPQFIFDALGIKNKGNFTRMLGMGATALGVGGTVASSIRNRNAYQQNPDNGVPFTPIRNVGAAILSGLSAGSAAGHDLLSSDKVTPLTGINSMLKSNQKNNDFISKGGTLFGAAGSYGQRLLTGEDQFDIDERELKTMEEQLKQREAALKPLKDVQSHYESLISRVNSKAEDSDVTSGTFRGVTGNYRAYNSALKAAYSDGWSIEAATGRRYFEFNGTKVYDYEAEDVRLGLLDANKDSYYELSSTGVINDASITADLSALDAAGEARLVRFNGNAGVKARTGVVKAQVSTEQDAINNEYREISDTRNTPEYGRNKSNRDRFGSGQ